MTYQSLLMLHHMKTVQNTPSDSVVADTFNNVLQTNERMDRRKEHRLRGKFWDKNFTLTLEELSSNGYICTFASDLSGHIVYQITSKGHRYPQLLLQSICRFLGKSIITPIAVSFLTTLITVRFF